MNAQNTESEGQTTRFAADLAAQIKPGDIILLRGPLGSGKSVFARSLIRSLTGEPDMDVPSPTFTLVQTYDTPKGPLWHFDLYRLKDPEEVYEIGWEEALSGGIAVIEWPERLGSLTPRAYLDIAFAPVENRPDSRTITVTDRRG